MKKRRGMKKLGFTYRFGFCYKIVDGKRCNRKFTKETRNSKVCKICKNKNYRKNKLSLLKALEARRKK